MKSRCTGIFALAVLLLIGCKQTELKSDVTGSTKGTISKNGMVVAAHPLAAQVGADILKQGGNAFDATIAVMFVMAVVYPEAGNIGGGGFVVYHGDDGDKGSLDFREKAPLSADKDMYLYENGEVIPRQSLEGHKAAGVPGAVDGMVTLHEKKGSMPWSALVQPAVELAQGFKLTPRGAYTINRAQDVFRKYNDSETCPFIAPDSIFEEGVTFVQSDLAKTLERIRDNGRAGFYEGPTAALIIEEMKDGSGGYITQADLDKYASVWREPLVGKYRGYEVISMPPPSSGGVALLQLLHSIEDFDLTQMVHNSKDMVHLMVELEKRVYADRATFLGDEDFYPVPKEMLLSDAYLEDRMKDITMANATPSQKIKEGEVEIIESIETTHFSVVDKDGNAVSLTTTINSYFGCKVMVDGAGFFLNNEMDDFSVKPGVPNQFGLVGSEANAIAPEKRMLSSMTPTILAKDGKTELILGSPGGSTIITSVFQTILNVVDFGMGMQEAVNAKRVHHQWLPDRILMEKDALDATAKEALISLGHELTERNGIGRVDAILRTDDGWEGGADPRGEDKAVGF